MAKKAEKKTRGAESKKAKATGGFVVAELPEDMRVLIKVYAGSKEGAVAAYSVIGTDRTVLAEGTAREIVAYTLGQEVEVGGTKYKRNVGTKQRDPVKRIKSEWDRGNLSFTIDDQVVEGDKPINTYFRKETAMKGGKPVMRDGKPYEFIGGVALVVSAIVVEGNHLATGYKTLDAHL